MFECAILKHGQVEAAAVPRNELWAVLFYPLEESLHDLALRKIRTEAEYPKSLGASQERGDHDHAVLRERQEIRIARLDLLEVHDLGHGLVVEIAELE